MTKLPSLRQRHARILATIGPATNTPEKLRQLVDAGLEAFRLNFSHGGHDVHEGVVKEIRKIEHEVSKPLTIVQDLQGPKIRLGDVEGKPVLQQGAIFTLDNDSAAGDGTRSCLPHPEILEVLQPGDKVFINDGLVRLEVQEKERNAVRCRVIAGGVISSRKGVNLPGVDLPISALTEKDKADLQFGLQVGVDWVAQSFVQHPKDVEELRVLVEGKALIMAKIEMPNAVERLEAILALADGIMVARGDLGVEMPLEEVPSIQKRIIRLCRQSGKPVVVATQMLESMIHNPSPTRAEVSDVANATFEGADALMLSAESAAGSYPVEAVTMMHNIICRVERSSAWRPLMDARHPEVEPQVGDAISHAAFQLAETLQPCAVVVFTESGSSAWRVARQRPLQPLLVLTPHAQTARCLGLGWGIHAHVASSPRHEDELAHMAVQEVVRRGIGEKGQQIVVVAGTPFGQKGSTNMVRVVTI